MTMMMAAAEVMRMHKGKNKVAKVLSACEKLFLPYCLFMRVCSVQCDDGPHFLLDPLSNICIDTIRLHDIQTFRSVSLFAKLIHTIIFTVIEGFCLRIFLNPSYIFLF